MGGSIRCLNGGKPREGFLGFGITGDSGDSRAPIRFFLNRLWRNSMSVLKKTDSQLFRAIYNETKRQEEGLELIASENYVSEAVLEAQGSVLTNKYAEGYPGKRYY